MKTEPDPIHIVKAKGNRLVTKDGQSLIDGVSSWWAVIHGYNNSSLNAALSQQMEKLSHVMLGGLTHQPALDLADKLVAITPKELTKVFFSDSGSVANEVALKMAIQYWKNKGNSKKSKLLSLKKAYHGDTTGVMALSDPDDSMHSLFSSILLKHIFLDAPLTGFDLPLTSLESSFNAVRKIFETTHESIAALIIEPILQGAGGMNVYSPHYLTLFRDLCTEFNILLICDEVATGFGRTGTYFAIDHAGISPDIMVLGKGMTGGYIGLAATIATDTVFNSFLDESWSKAFMHGPTFMGNPLACAVSLESIRLFEETNCLGNIKIIEETLKKGLLNIDRTLIKDCRIIGATGIVELFDSKDMHGFQKYAVDRGVWLRPFGPFIYTMPAYISSEEDITKITQVIRDWVYLKNKT
jgi:adenosylmethionine---8-amino-7-oxononanoate aminotransferase